MLRPTLRSEVAVVGEVSRDWLKDVGWWDRIVVFQEPLIQLLDAFRVFGQFRQKSFKLFLWHETRKSSVAVPVPQQSLRSRRKKGRKNRRKETE